MLKLAFSLTGRAPRVLLDAQGRMPHEALAATVPEATARDPKWARLQRVFKVAFQNSIDLRYGSAEELRAALRSLNDSPPPDEGVARALAKVEAARESQAGQRLHQNQRTALAALNRFFGPLQKRLNEMDFEAGGQGPVILAPGTVVQTKLSIKKRGYNQPQTRIVSRISFEDARFEASYLVGDASLKVYYTGPFADQESLAEAAEGRVGPVLTEALETYAEALNRGYNVPKES
jgi:hypothetical protein